MSQCVSVGCYHRGTGHKFPKNVEMRKKWLIAIKRESYTPGRSSRVCSAHFLPSDYFTESAETGLPNTIKRLKPGAVPSLFSWKQNLEDALKVDDRGERVKGRELKRKAKIASSHVRKKRLCVTGSHDDSSSSEPCAAANNSRASSNVCSVETQVQEIVNQFDPDHIIVCEVDSIGVAEVDAEQIEKSPTSGNIDVQGGKKCPEPKTFKTVGTQTMQSSNIFEQLRRKPELVSYYTGLENFEKFMYVFASLGPASEELNYRFSRVENVSLEDQFLMTLMKLRLGITDFGLAVQFFVSRKTVQNIVVTWLNFMYHEWKELDVWPSKDLVHYFMPDGFRKQYPSTRVIIDGTEIPIASPQNPVHAQAAFSTYKNRTTQKILVGCTPNGLISYCSDAYGGSVSDRAIVERSNLVEKCDPGDSVMADRGFTVQDLFLRQNVAVNIPAFLKGRAQLPGITLLKDRKLASKRVHIERIIGLVKTFKILKKELPPYYVPLGSQITFVCCMLCNFREGIINEWA